MAGATKLFGTTNLYELTRIIVQTKAGTQARLKALLSAADNMKSFATDLKSTQILGSQASNLHESRTSETYSRKMET